MDIEIERLTVQIASGASSSMTQQGIGKLVSIMLEEILRSHATELAFAGERRVVSSLTVGGLKTRSGASDEEIARLVAGALSRTILKELEMKP